MSDQTATGVNTLRGLLAGGPPPIAVSFSDEATDDDLRLAKRGGLDVAELRIDRYRSYEPSNVLGQVRRFAAFPTIATIRRADEGGDWTGTDRERLDLFEAVLPSVDAVDIELRSAGILPQLVALAKDQDKVVIVSNHNFEQTPSRAELDRMASEAKALGADVVKLSAMTHSHEDLRALASFLIQNEGLGLIVIGMGGHGSASRVFFPALGSRLTYAYVNRPVSGQLTFDDTFTELRRYFPEFNEKKITDLEILDGA